ncbi:non-homologous end joining protein Ku [Pseudonocardia pini]|uniref:non-homologous end joining protein Ku n=1 Tax=Pseudonocardia pini TaxID=2758030 RepID=UPI001FE3909A|nr:Ku protein [Pseudonocardia pini]
MARAIWTGTISFGLVSIPVGLFSATEDHTVGFHQFERGTSDRVRIQRVNERTGEEVEYSDIVKGAEVGDGEYVIVEPDELDSIAPGRSQSLEISDFVDLADIDPVFFQRTYWLAPTAEAHAKPYALLRRAMADGGKAAVGTFVMRGKEYLAAVRSDGDVLALHTLHFADEVRDPTAELDHIPSSRTSGGEKELRMAATLIESMSTAWKPDQYRDTHRDRVAKLVADKHAGREVVTESAAPEPTDMSDLMEALQRSIDEATGKRSKAPDLGSASKKELLALAKELDVAGRSSMSRDELQEAVQESGGQGSGGQGSGGPKAS